MRVATVLTGCAAATSAEQVTQIEVLCHHEAAAPVGCGQSVALGAGSRYFG